MTLTPAANSYRWRSDMDMFIEMHMEDLLPCPFCKTKRPELNDSLGLRYFEGYAITCIYCGAQGPYADDEDEAIKEWNSYATMPKIGWDKSVQEWVDAGMPYLLTYGDEERGNLEYIFEILVDSRTLIDDFAKKYALSQNLSYPSQNILHQLEQLDNHIVEVAEKLQRLPKTKTPKEEPSVSVS